jgi:hypothetical protein
MRMCEEDALARAQRVTVRSAKSFDRMLGRGHIDRDLA